MESRGRRLDVSRVGCDDVREGSDERDAGGNNVGKYGMKYCRLNGILMKLD